MLGGGRRWCWCWCWCWAGLGRTPEGFLSFCSRCCASGGAGAALQDGRPAIQPHRRCPFQARPLSTFLRRPWSWLQAISKAETTSTAWAPKPALCAHRQLRNLPATALAACSACQWPATPAIARQAVRLPGVSDIHTRVHWAEGRSRREAFPRAGPRPRMQCDHPH